MSAPLPHAPIARRRTQLRALQRAVGDSEDPVEILEATLALLGDRVVLSTSLGPQSIVLLDLLHSAGRAVDALMLDTGLLFPETLALKEAVEARFGIRIRAIRPVQSLAAQAEAHGGNLWRRDPDRCCQLRKVDPLARALAPYDGWFAGLRRDQSAARAHVRPVAWDLRHDRVKVSPLWAWSRAQVFDWLEQRRLPFNPLLEQGYTSVGCQPCTHPNTDPRDERAGRWAGAEKTECGIHLSLYPES